MREEKLQQDNYDLQGFINTIAKIRNTSPNSLDDFIPTKVIAKSARLAKVSTNGLFQIGLRWAVLNAQADATMFAQPVYRRQFLERLEMVTRAVMLLRQQITDLLSPGDSSTYLARMSLCDALSIGAKTEAEASGILGRRRLEEFDFELSCLLQSIEVAKKFSPREVLAERGRPLGAGGLCGECVG